MQSTPAHQAFLRTRFFPGLDGLRCLSIVLVVTYHVGGLSWGLVRRGYLGVTLFFAISGFLITSLLLREVEEHGAISLRRFYARRSLRIFPLYYAVLLAYVVLTALFEKAPEVRAEFFGNVPSFLTYTSNWFVPAVHDRRITFYFAWSLATEEQFYLLWPAAIRVGHRRGAVAFMAGLLAISLLARGGVIAGWLDGTALPVRILASISPPICLGSLAAYAVRSPTGFAVLHRVLGRRWAPPLLMAAVLVGIGVERTPMVLLWPLVVALVVACCLSTDDPLRPVLTWAPVRFVGTISYGIYLLHMLVVGLVRRALPGAGFRVQWPLALLGSILLASLSFRYFERWFLQLKERFSPDALAGVQRSPAVPASRAEGSIAVFRR